MLSKVYTGTMQGLDALRVAVETDVSGGLPSLTLVGLPDTTLRESRERVRSAVKNSGYEFPMRRITVNLAPANTKKAGNHFDLPMAVGLLLAFGRIKTAPGRDTALLGELSLDGSLLRTEQCFALVAALRKRGMKNFIVPAANADELSIIDDISIYPAEKLMDVADFLNGLWDIPCIKGDFANIDKLIDDKDRRGAVDYADVRGQEAAKRAMLIAAAGRHGIALVGPPGAGKTMLASRFPTILPELSYEEMLEVMSIKSISGLGGGKVSVISKDVPFRDPHHSATAQALLGGGPMPVPGEISLAHRGVLFLDELPEFARTTLDSLRQPLEEGFITISRATSKVRYPCEFMLVTAMNPCPCGYYGCPGKTCVCTESKRKQYFSKISGPLTDRIDIHVDIDPITYDELRPGDASAQAMPGPAAGKEAHEPPTPRISPASCTSSGELRALVLKARLIQEERYRHEEFSYNAHIPGKLTDLYCKPDKEGETLLRLSFEKLAMSARSGIIALRLARTIADIEGSENVRAAHVAEALAYRRSSRYE